jgi:hypothetical protein
MTQSAYDIRHSLVSSILHLSEKQQSELINGLPAIDKIIKALDLTISGKDPEPDTNTVEAALVRFRKFVGTKHAFQPSSGSVPMEYRDWYDREFSRLWNGYHKPSTNSPLIEQIYFPRQSGISTFIRLYCQFTKDYTIGTMLHRDDAIIGEFDTIIHLGNVTDVTNALVAIDQAESIQQLITENVPAKFVEMHSLTENYTAVYNAYSGRLATTIFQYYTCEAVTG